MSYKPGFIDPLTLVTAAVTAVTILGTLLATQIVQKTTEDRIQAAGCSGKSQKACVGCTPDNHECRWVGGSCTKTEKVSNNCLSQPTSNLGSSNVQTGANVDTCPQSPSSRACVGDVKHSEFACASAGQCVICCDGLFKYTEMKNCVGKQCYTFNPPPEPTYTKELKPTPNPSPIIAPTGTTCPKPGEQRCVNDQIQVCISFAEDKIRWVAIMNQTCSQLTPTNSPTPTPTTITTPIPGISPYCSQSRLLGCAAGCNPNRYGGVCNPTPVPSLKTPTPTIPTPKTTHASDVGTARFTPTTVINDCSTYPNGGKCVPNDWYCEDRPVGYFRLANFECKSLTTTHTCISVATYKRGCIQPTPRTTSTPTPPKNPTPIKAPNPSTTPNTPTPNIKYPAISLSPTPPSKQCEENLQCKEWDPKWNYGNEYDYCLKNNQSKYCCPIGKIPCANRSENNWECVSSCPTPTTNSKTNYSICNVSKDYCKKVSTAGSLMDNTFSPECQFNNLDDVFKCCNNYNTPLSCKYYSGYIWTCDASCPNTPNPTPSTPTNRSTDSDTTQEIVHQTITVSPSPLTSLISSLIAPVYSGFISLRNLINPFE